MPPRGDGPALAAWLRELEGIHPRSVDLGLDRIRRVWTALGAPRPAPIVVTVAGTNGKGSTVAVIDAVARGAGRRVGTTTSPHLQRFAERIAVDGAPVDEAVLVAAFERIDAARRGLGDGAVTLTYFEFAILGAIVVLADAGVDVAVLEVGLGGRLDAVNLIDADVAVITPVDLDHQDWLGDDRETIGAEKAGILRSGARAVFGDRDPPASVLGAAAALGVVPRRLGVDFDLGPDAVAGGARTFRGVDREGAAVGFAPVPAPALHDDAIATGLQAVLEAGIALGDVAGPLDALRLAGRMDRRRSAGVEVLLDVAHNPHAARALAARLTGSRPWTAVLGTYADKDAPAMVAALAPHLRHLHLVPTPGPRGQGAADLAARLGDGAPPSTAHGTVAEGLHAALADARPVLVCGSFTVVGAALDLLDESPEAEHG